MKPGKNKLLECYRINNSKCLHRVESRLCSDQAEKRDLTEYWEHSVGTPEESLVYGKVKQALEKWLFQAHPKKKLTKEPKKD